jgi:hypothetical protein
MLKAGYSDGKGNGDDENADASDHDEYVVCVLRRF